MVCFEAVLGNVDVEFDFLSSSFVFVQSRQVPADLTDISGPQLEHLIL